MNEAMFNLYELTGNASHLKAGLRFNHYQWTAPLAIGQDNLDGSHGNAGGNHANTHLPGPCLPAYSCLPACLPACLPVQMAGFPSLTLVLALGSSEIVGSAKGYELTGNLTMKAIATNFFHILTAGESKHWDPARPGGMYYNAA